MPFASKSDIMDELAGTLRDMFDTLLDPDYTIQVEPRMLVNPTGILAAVDIFPADPATDLQSAGFASDHDPGAYQFTLRVRTTEQDNDATQQILLDVADKASPLYIPDNILSDPTLNGLATSVDFFDESGWRLYPPGNLVGLQWTCLVIAAES